MSKAVIKSVSPQQCNKLIDGETNYILSRTAPKYTPFKCYVYCTKGETLRIAFTDKLQIYKANCKVIGEAIIDKTDAIFGCWHVAQFKLYDTPKELKDFKRMKICARWKGGWSNCDKNCGAFFRRECVDGVVAHPIAKAPRDFCYAEEDK